MNQWICAIRWSNPYAEPPNGQPREIARMILEAPDGSGCPRPPVEFTALAPIGSGYGVHIGFVHKPIKHWSLERTIAYRRKRLEQRIQKKYPLFAEEMIQQAMAAKSDYYGVGTT